MAKIKNKKKSKVYHAPGAKNMDNLIDDINPEKEKEQSVASGASIEDGQDNDDSLEDGEISNE